MFKTKRDKVLTATGVTAAVLSVSSSAFATVTPGTVDQTTVDSMTSQFNNVEVTAVAALAAIAGVAILMFAGIYAWKYGKKVFSIIAK